MLRHWQENIRIDEQFITSYWLSYALPACEGLWVLLTNFIFIRNILQQCLISNWISVIKTKLLFAPAAILKRQILQATYLSTVCLYYCSIVPYCINLLQLFYVVSSGPNSIYLNLEYAVFLALLFELICSYRKDILSSILCCSLIIIIVIMYNEARQQMTGYYAIWHLGGRKNILSFLPAKSWT